MTQTIDKILIANRGAIAVRIARTIRAMGKYSIGVYASEDVDSGHIDAVDEAHCLGTGVARDTYLDQDKIIEIAVASGANAIHPGYGFLSENADFVARCDAAGIRFLGPTAEQMKVFGLKHSARDLAIESNVPLLPGSGLLASVEDATIAAAQIGYPVILKSTAGGGGIGMRRCDSEQALREAFAAVQRLAGNNFGHEGVFVERYVERARHVEVQVFGDGAGHVLCIGDHDCSTQRRQQKVVEECPAPNIPDETREVLWSSANSLLAAVNYQSAGTVEFVFDEGRGEAYFLEVNTRLQVEHGVTEMVYGIDLVEWMIRLAEGSLSPLDEISLEPHGHAIETRIYAEDPAKDFQPTPGLLTHVSFPEISSDLRIDHWLVQGVEISPSFDPMLAKVIGWGDDREAARLKLADALQQSALHGTETNLDFLRAFLNSDTFKAARLATSVMDEFEYHPRVISVLRGGTLTTLQDCPGRVGYWHVGVPPSGPFDDLSFRIGNAMLGNPEEAPGLEITVAGPELLFSAEASFVVAGASLAATLDGETIENWRVYSAPAGSKLSLGKVEGGMRSYLLLAGGFAVPEYLGSAATFTLGQFGGHCGRVLRPGDVLHMGEMHRVAEMALDASQLPTFAGNAGQTWHLHVIYGPHGAPDFFTETDIDTFFGTDYEVHFNSSRTGVRLVGPKPDWARENGGEAGLHPSNIHDNAYAIGTVDFTGDMPVILGPDGPSLGGFVCPATVIRADRWKLGQLSPGDKLRFVPVSIHDAVAKKQAIDSYISMILSAASGATTGTATDLVFPSESLPVVAPKNAVLRSGPSLGDPSLALTFRPSGDDYLLVELGEQRLDIGMRFRIHALHRLLEEYAPDGILEMTPGIRSIQLHYVPERCSLASLVTFVQEMDAQLTDIEDIEVPSRIVHLPLSFDDPACRKASEKYMQSVRPDAPWCPDNLEFIRRINGLDSIEQVRDIVFDASYVVLGLGDVYLGAPVATPLDPRQRLVTTKYNPARTWTAENSVGIGGAYLCVYGMEGPGGYQFVGRTIQMWNRYRQTDVFDEPWLLRFFDQIQFYPVPADELLALREEFIRGRFTPRIEETRFALKDHNAFVAAHQAEIDNFVEARDAAFDAELDHWRENGLLRFEDATDSAQEEDELELDLPDGQFVIESHVSGNVWQLCAEIGQQVDADETLLVVESMKMELDVAMSRSGKVVKLLVQPGQQVASGQRLAICEEVA